MFMQLAPFGSFIYENDIVSGYRIHREDKFRKRLGMWLRDEQRMFYEVMPAAANRARMTDVGWIQAASRQNFVRYLSVASERLSPVEKEAVVPHFLTWAERIGARRCWQNSRTESGS